jgi:hypothetical protein
MIDATTAVSSLLSRARRIQELSAVIQQRFVAGTQANAVRASAVHRHVATVLHVGISPLLAREINDVVLALYRPISVKPGNVHVWRGVRDLNEPA